MSATLPALVLARGRGRRMQEPAAGHATALTEAQRDAARAGWKALMPVGAHILLDFILSSLADAGIVDVGLVIGPEQREAFSRYDAARATRRTRITFVEQAEPLGTANAVLSAQPWVGDRAFLVFNGDNLYPADVLSGLRDLGAPGLPVFQAEDLVRSSNIPAERIAEFAIVRRSPDGSLERIIEKPSAIERAAHGSRLVSMNAWRFDPRIFDACRDVKMSSRGELELPDAVALAIERGVRFTTFRARGAVLDLSRQGDIAEVSRHLAGLTPAP